MSKFINPQELEAFYRKCDAQIKNAKEVLKKPLTLTEKILFTHFYNEENDLANFKRGETTLELSPDRVIMQDATAQMAVLQFISTGVKRVQTPSSVHCDHLVRAKTGAKEDLENACETNKEVYEFLGSAARKYGMDFWEAGSGIIHTIALENYAFPGGIIIGTDSHTPTSSGLCMLAIGVGGADAVDVMVNKPWQLKNPEVIGVKLTGELPKWTGAKDIILYLLGELSSKGGTGKVVEYFGEACDRLSCTEKSTITNMGAELGATTSVFAYDESMQTYLRATKREDIEKLASEFSDNLKPDQEVLDNPEKYYDQVIEIDLGKIEPSLTGPHATDAYFSISKMKAEHANTGLPKKVSSCLIGSCTNASYEDFACAASIIENALEKGLSLKTELLVSPGSNQVEKTLERDGILDTFRKAGAIILSNSCGPCIGQWDRSYADEVQYECSGGCCENKVNKNEDNVIVTTFNRNFKKRNDGQEVTNAFLAGPEMTTALAFAGVIDFDPRTDAITNKDGAKIKLEISNNIPSLPPNGFVEAELDYAPPAEDGSDLEVVVSPTSERIQLLKPFDKPDLEKNFSNLVILAKAQGKCTTDHISPAGPWLKFRGHLDNISKNMYSGAVNAFSEEIGKGKNIFNGEVKEYNEVAREYRKDGQGWVVIGDENYGEGSSREHAAMEPRYLGCRAIISKSFARIAETNLKKQGILPLWLDNPSDYDKFQEEDKITIFGLDALTQNKEVRIRVEHKDGSDEEIFANHTMSDEQVRWFYAGSALNKAAEDLK